MRQGRREIHHQPDTGSAGTEEEVTNKLDGRTELDGEVRLDELDKILLN